MMTGDIAPPPAGESPLLERWYYHQGGHRHGPVSTRRLRQLIESGELSPMDRIWDEPTQSWVPVIKFEQMRDLKPRKQPAAPAEAEQAKPGHRGRRMSLMAPMLAVMVLVWGVLIVALWPKHRAGAPGAGMIEPVSAAAAPVTPTVTFEKDVQPVLEKFCYQCHNDQKHKGDLNLKQFMDEKSVLRKRKDWHRVFEQLSSGEMPPDDKPQPTLEERGRITDWIASVIDKYDCTGPQDPGRVTIRRLNRAEYNNTIRDLIGLDLKPADKFPTDDVGDGFDNIGDVLSLSPILLEKYMGAAESVLDEAIVTKVVSAEVTQHLEAERMSSTIGDPDGRFVNLFSNGEVFATVDIPADGRYRFAARAWATQAGDELARMELRIDNKTVKASDIKGTEDKMQTIAVETTIAKGSHKVSAAFVNDFYDPKNRDPNRRDRNLIIDWVELKGPLDAPPPTMPASHQRIFIAAPMKDHPPRDAAKTIIEHFATRAFRRPVKADEVERYLSLFDVAQQGGENFEASVKLALQGVLVSPHFLFRVETDKPTQDPMGAYALNDYELASRLSYFLWSSMPDDELFDLAGKGELHKPEVLEAQAMRMIHDPRSRAMIDNFAAQWLELRNLEIMSPDAKKFPAFTPELRKSMYEETEWFLASVMLEDRPILDLLDADYTFVDQRLAKFYGIDGVEGDKMRRVSLTGDRRGGVLAMAAVLTITSNPTRTSPVLRGKWVLTELLGSPPPPPPANVAPLDEVASHNPNMSLRAQMELHRENPMCASCHKRMDPIGFALENYDAIGRWRDQEHDQPIDTRGVLPDGTKFDGPNGLKTILMARKDDFARCLTEKMLTYALGRSLEYYDACATRKIVTRLKDNDYRFSALVKGIVESYPFRYRRNLHDDEVTDEQ
ncbi:MAG: DUF1592 domain-containing protein [Planctomycetes bacterium]|nr:DUF1592 domain-containing protein [Planctomycetota bacterium]